MASKTLPSTLSGQRPLLPRWVVLRGGGKKKGKCVAFYSSFAFNSTPIETNVASPCSSWIKRLKLWYQIKLQIMIKRMNLMAVILPSKPASPAHLASGRLKGQNSNKRSGSEAHSSYETEIYIYVYIYIYIYPRVGVRNTLPRSTSQSRQSIGRSRDIKKNWPAPLKSPPAPL